MSYRILLKYFPELSQKQKEDFIKLGELYKDWNNKLNLISRKDLDNLYEKHILHSLSIAKIISFKKNTKILDVGTGGGFPGIPLAIIFPKCKFTLVDSIVKKIKVVEDISKKLNLKNVETINDRVENLNEKYDFVVSRAVTQLPKFIQWVGNKITGNNFNSLSNGILYLKGGDLTNEIHGIKNITLYSISDFFTEFFFKTKKVLHLEIKK